MRRGVREERLWARKLPNESGASPTNRSRFWENGHQAPRKRARRFRRAVRKFATRRRVGEKRVGNWMMWAGGCEYSELEECCAVFAYVWKSYKRHFPAVSIVAKTAASSGSTRHFRVKRFSRPPKKNPGPLRPQKNRRFCHEWNRARVRWMCWMGSASDEWMRMVWSVYIDRMVVVKRLLTVVGSVLVWRLQLAESMGSRRTEKWMPNIVCTTIYLLQLKTYHLERAKLH